MWLPASGKRPGSGMQRAMQPNTGTPIINSDIEAYAAKGGRGDPAAFLQR
jgi:hypothetical protein